MIIIKILLFFFIPVIVIMICEAIGISNSAFQLITGFSLWVYVVFFKMRSFGNNNVVKKKPAPNATPCFAIIDVETTGLIRYDETPTKKSLKEDPDNFPLIVQIAWLTLSRDYEIVRQKDYYIKQHKPIPAESTEVHKITNEICEKKGKDLQLVLKEFSDDISECDYYVGHNVMFDKRVIEAECIRSRINKPFKYMKKYDTMSMGREVMGRRRFKLKDMGLKFLGKKQMKQFSLHSASDDVAITTACFAWLHKNGYKY